MSATNGATIAPVVPPEEEKEIPLFARMERSIKAELDVLNIRRAQIKDQLDAADREINRFRRVLRAMDPEAPELSSKSTKKGGRKKKAVSKDVLKWMAGLIAKVDKEEFTVLDCFFADGGTNPDRAGHHYAGMNRLRDIEYVCKAGKDPETKRQLWRLMPDADEVLERISKGQLTNA